jgi:hypothetical protein
MHSSYGQYLFAIVNARTITTVVRYKRSGKRRARMRRRAGRNLVLCQGRFLGLVILSILAMLPREGQREDSG